MFRSPVLSALALTLGLAYSPTPASAVEPDKPTQPMKVSPNGLRSFEREMAANPKFAKQVAEAAQAKDKQALLKLMKPFIPTADVKSLTISPPTVERRRVIKIKIVIKGDNDGEVNVPINP